MNSMKKSLSTIIKIILVVCAMGLASGYQSSAQHLVDMKQIKNQVRKIKRQGYKPLPGYPSLMEQQIALAEYTYERDSLGKCLYFDAYGNFGEHEDLTSATEQAKKHDVSSLVEQLVGWHVIGSSDLTEYINPHLPKVDSVKVDLCSFEMNGSDGCTYVISKDLFLSGEISGTIIESYDESYFSLGHVYRITFNPQAYRMVRSMAKPVVGRYAKTRNGYTVYVQQVLDCEECETQGWDMKTLLEIERDTHENRYDESAFPWRNLSAEEQ